MTLIQDVYNGNYRDIFTNNTSLLEQFPIQKGEFS